MLMVVFLFLFSSRFLFMLLCISSFMSMCILMFMLMGVWRCFWVLQSTGELTKDSADRLVNWEGLTQNENAQICENIGSAFGKVHIYQCLYRSALTASIDVCTISRSTSIRLSMYQSNYVYLLFDYISISISVSISIFLYLSTSISTCISLHLFISTPISIYFLYIYTCLDLHLNPSIVHLSGRRVTEYGRL